MSNRSKKRRKRPTPRARPAAAESPPASLEQPKVAASGRRDPEGPPPAPWGSFPLVELVVLVGLVMLGVGFFAGGSRSTTLIGTGLALCSLAGLELTVREHFSGYRSHSTLLGSLVGIVVLAVLYVLLPGLLPPVGRVVAALICGVAAGATFVYAFRRRSGQSIKLR